MVDRPQGTYRRNSIQNQSCYEQICPNELKQSGSTKRGLFQQDVGHLETPRLTISNGRAVSIRLWIHGE